MKDLQKLLKDEDVEIRRETLESLKGKKNKRYINLLLTAMEDPNWRIRNTATEILLEDYQVENYIHGLINLLYKDDNAGARNSAIEALIRLNKKATPYLIKAFNTTNKDVKKFIIDVLGSFKDERSLPLMLNALKDDDENVRATAIEQIGRMGESSMVEALIEIVESEDIWTAYPAVDALGRIGDKKAIPVLLKALEKKTLRSQAIKALSLIAEPDTLRYILPFLNDPTKTIQEEVILSLERFYRKGINEDIITENIKKYAGDDAIDILINHALSHKTNVKISAILALGLMKDERAFKPLLEISQDENFIEDVRRALLFIGSDKPESLLKLFETENVNQKRFISDIAARIASPIFYPIFLNFLESDDGHLRSLAALGLSKIGNKDAIKNIKRLLNDPYPDVQESAIEALANFADYLSIEELLEMLRDKDPVIRKNSALLLGKIGAKEAVPALGFTLKDGDPEVRKACVKSFSMIKTDESIQFLKLALADEEPYIRVMATLSLSEIGGESVFDSLSLLVSDIDDSVRVAVAKALGKLQDSRALEPLIKLLKDKNGFVVVTAIESLGKIGGERAKNELLNCLKINDPEIRRTAIKALSSFDGIEDVLLPYLKDKDWATRKVTVEALSKSNDKIVREELGRLYDREEDPIVKNVIKESLIRNY
jgi:HEAT repeat protein